MVYNTEGLPLSQLRRLHLQDDDKAFMNRVKAQGKGQFLPIWNSETIFLTSKISLTRVILKTGIKLIILLIILYAADKRRPNNAQILDGRVTVIQIRSKNEPGMLSKTRCTYSYMEYVAW